MTIQPWMLSAEIQGVRVRIRGQDRQLRARAEEFVHPLVGRAWTAALDELEFTLGLLDRESDQAIAVGRKALIQFVNVSCSWEEPCLGFRTKDGSFIKADIDGGRAWGRLSSEVLAARHLFTDLLMAPLMEMLKQRGYYGLHAAALTKDGAGYLFPGGAGSGKTTLALGLIKQGFAYLADDKLLLRREDNAILALAFTRHFNIDPQITHYYPELHFVNDLDPLPFTVKRPVDVSSVYPDTFASCTWPRYLIHIERTRDSRSEICRLGPAESFNRLVHQTIFAARKETALRQLELLGALVEATESYLLRNGQDLHGAPERIGDLVPQPSRTTAAMR